eukprot:5620928-Pleurochrysis_carterae.AAC.1
MHRRASASSHARARGPPPFGTRVSLVRLRAPTDRHPIHKRSVELEHRRPITDISTDSPLTVYPCRVFCNRAHPAPLRPLLPPYPATLTHLMAIMADDGRLRLKKPSIRAQSGALADETLYMRGP